MPWNTEESKPPDSPPTRARLLRRRFSWRRRSFDSYNWTANTGGIVSQAHGRHRLQLRLFDFLVAVLCLWTFVAGLTQAESVTNASSTSMANSTGAAPPTVAPEAGPTQTANRPMESSLNKVFYSALLFFLVPLAAFVTATLIKIICPIAKTPGSFCCPKYQIGDSGEGDAQRSDDAEKAGRDEQRVKNALLLLFTIDVNEEKEEEEELKEIEKAMKRLKERRLRKMRIMMRQRAFRIGADVDDGKISTAFPPPGEAQPINQEDASGGLGVTEEDQCIDTDSNPVGNIDPTDTEPSQEEFEETTQRHMDPIANNPNDAVSIKENKTASNSSLVDNISPQNLPTVGGSGSASKTEPSENDGPSCAANPPVSILEATSTEQKKSSFIPNSTGIIGSVDTSSSSNINNSSICAVEVVDVQKPKRNLSTISSSTVTSIQIHGECNDSIPEIKPPLENSEPKEVVLKDKEQPAKQTASLPSVPGETLQQQQDGNPTHITSSSPAKNNEPVNINCQATSKNHAHEKLPETKATTAETATGNRETRQVLVSSAAIPMKQTCITDISKTEHVQTNTKLERVNIDTDVSSSLRSIASHTCSNSGERIPRGERKEEASRKPQGLGRNTAPLKDILVQTVDID